MLLIVLIVSLLSIVTGMFFNKIYVKMALRSKLTRRVHRALAGEKHASDFLVKHGFKILGEQVTISPEMSVDGVTESFVLRADFLALKNGRKTVIDAKSGPKAADPCNPDTRRRMFEYLYYYDVHDVYIYDDVNKQLRKIKFPVLEKNKIQTHLFIWGICVGLLMAIVALIIYCLLNDINLEFGQNTLVRGVSNIYRLRSNNFF